MRKARAAKTCRDANVGRKMPPMKSTKVPVPDPPSIPKLWRIVGNIRPEEIKPLWKIRKLGYEYFWVKMFEAWPWHIAHDLGKIFMLGTNHFRYSEFGDRPAAGLLCPPEPSRDYWRRKSYLKDIEEMRTRPLKP
jgi:hypothetical protein